MLLSAVVSVCQCFAVLEDGALAHNLQEQESKYITLSCQADLQLHNFFFSNTLWAAFQLVSVVPLLVLSLQHEP